MATSNHARASKTEPAGRPDSPSPPHAQPRTPLPPVLAERIIDYGPFISQTTLGFVGREWLRAQVDDFLQAVDKRFFLLSGEPGLGKTAFLAHLASERGYIHHFVSAKDLDWLSPVAFAESVGAQLARRFGAWVLAEEVPPPGIVVDQDIGTVGAGGTAIGVLISQYVGLPVEEMARKLILRPLRRLAGQAQQPVVLIVDAVDEASRYSGQMTISDLLIGLGTTANIRLVLTSHPGPVVESLSFDLEASGLLHLPIQGEQHENLVDVRAFLRQATSEPGVSQALAAEGVDPASFVEEVTTRSEGNFLYVTSLLDAIRSGQAGLDLTALPVGLARYYRDQVRRLKRAAGPEWRRIYRPVLGVLSVARAALRVDQLADLTDVERDAIIEVIAKAHPLIEEREGVGGLPAYAWYHRATADFLLSERDNPLDWFQPASYHAQIADRISAHNPDPAQITDDYALHNLTYHTRQAGADHFPQLYACITPAVRRARRARFGSDAAFSQDLAEVIEAALSEGLVQGLPQLVRCGLIDATLSSMVTEVPPELLRELAWLGQWPRALSLAQLGSRRRGVALQAIVEGLLFADTSEGLDLARQVALQIPAQGDDTRNRARALAQIAVRLAAGGQAEEATDLLGEAAVCAQRVPSPDERARALAAVARLRFPLEPDLAKDSFDDALRALDEMEVELDTFTSQDVSAASMVSQMAPESSWVMDHTPFDTLGSKARATADVAADMARAGVPGAQELFDRAEEMASSIPEEGLDAVFGQHARTYVAAQRALPVEAIPEKPEPASLENRLLAQSRIEADRRGFYPLALLALARALAEGGEVDEATAVLRRAKESAEAAEGGYRAKLLADMAGLLQEIGHADQAALWAQEATQIAGGDADLLVGYRALLEEVGYTWAAGLREVALSRAWIQKRRYYSDKALAEMTLALAERELEGAWSLVDSIRDASQRMRAVAAVAGHLARQSPSDVAAFLRDRYPSLESESGKDAAVQVLQQELTQSLANAVQVRPEDHDYLLAAAIQVLAPLAPLAAQELSLAISDLGFKVGALVAAAHGAMAQGLPDESLWEEAWQAAQAAPEATTSLGLAAGQIASRWYQTCDLRADVALAHALDAVREEPSLVERIDASVEIAATLAPFQPDQSQTLLDEAQRLSHELAAGRAQGQALSRIAGVQMALDPGRACRLLAGLRGSGRDSFLDGVARIVPGAACLGGTELIGQMVQALEHASGFFSS